MVDAGLLGRDNRNTFLAIHDWTDKTSAANTVEQSK